MFRAHVYDYFPLPLDQELQIIRQLPIFKVANGSYFVALSAPGSNSASSYGTIKDSSKLSPELFPSHILSHYSPQVLQLYRYAGVSIISRSSYFKNTLLPNALELHSHLPAPVEKDLFEMITSITLLLDEDKNFGQILKDFSFVPSGVSLPTNRAQAGTGREQEKGHTASSRALFKPSELFDPEVEELERLLDPSFFPAAQFQREDVLATLRNVGLHSALDWTGVIACARSIEAMPPPSVTPDRATESLLPEGDDDRKESDSESLSLTPRQERGACLFQYLIKNLGRLVGETNSSTKKRSSIFSLRGLFASDSAEKVNISTIEESILTLRSIAWVPVHRTPLDPFMPWPVASSELARADVAPPAHCRPSSDAWWCSSSRLLALLPAQVAVVSRTFAWDAPLPIATIASQLRDIAAKYEELKGQAERQDANGSVSLLDVQKSREALSALIPLLYQRLNNAEVPEQTQIVTVLRPHPWIWVGDHFVHPSRVAFSATLSLTPYLYAIPQDLAVYSSLLNMFDVKETFSSRDYVAVLHQMAVDTKSTGNTDGVSQHALSDTLIDMAVSLVTLLSSEGGGGGSFRPLDHTIYVPDHVGKLATASSLVTDDVPWMNGAEYSSTRAGIRLCHPNISSQVAGRIGVKSLRHILVDRSVDTLFLEDESALNPSRGIVAFGPSESLTGRLRTILDMYPDGNPIFSELIQNADDAGASVVRIMIDENNYPVESLMAPSVSALQGPALLFFNDATFKEADFRSLARIGQGSKLEKLSTTGRFGLGFNSVYHLTDTPSFVSGEHLVVFDPHTSCMPGTTPSQPGLRMKYLGNNLNHTFPDQFRPYQYFGCDFKQSFPGTLFRFPFRNTAMARRSEISKRSYSVADVNVLLEQLSAELPQYLIFLRSVSAIEIYRIAEGSTVPILLQRAQSSTSRLISYNDQSLLQHFEKNTTVPAPVAGCSTEVQAETQVMSKDGFYEQLSSTPDDKLPTSVFHLTVETSSSPIVTETELGTGTTCTSTETAESTVEYLVATGLRGGSAKQLACSPKMRHLKLVPVRSVVSLC